MNEIILSLDPFLARKIKVVALERGLTFTDALFFLLESVITPHLTAESPEA